METADRPAWRTAFDTAYAAHKDRLLTLAAALTGDRSGAEDVVHDVFATLLKETWRLGNGADIMPFLVVSVRNRAFDLLRRRTRRQAREREHGDRVVLPTLDPSLLNAQAEEVERLLRQVSLLPDELKEALSLRTWGEMTFEAIAELQQVSKSTAHARYTQAIEALRRGLAVEDKP